MCIFLNKIIIIIIINWEANVGLLKKKKKLNKKIIIKKSRVSLLLTGVTP